MDTASPFALLLADRLAGLQRRLLPAGKNRLSWRKTGKNANAAVMRIYLINLARRPDRLAAMAAQAQGLELRLERVEALDAADAEAGLDAWFEPGGPLGEIPRGDKACLLSHRRAWELFAESGEAHAAFRFRNLRRPQAGLFHLRAHRIYFGLDGVKALGRQHLFFDRHDVLLDDGAHGVELGRELFRLRKIHGAKVAEARVC